MHDIAGALAVQFKIDEQTVRGQLIERVTSLLNSVADEIDKLDDESRLKEEIEPCENLPPMVCFPLGD
jgi:hypothetical protein